MSDGLPLGFDLCGESEGFCELQKKSVKKMWTIIKKHQKNPSA